MMQLSYTWILYSSQPGIASTSSIYYIERDLKVWMALLFAGLVVMLSLSFAESQGM